MTALDVQATAVTGIAGELRAALAPDRVITDQTRLRTYECDGITDLGPIAPRHPIPARVAYHDACHLAHAQGIRAQPRAALRSIPDLTVMDIPEADICCGSAGIYNLVQPEPAEELGRRKVDHIRSTDPDAVVTSNAGCLLQIRRYLEAGVPLFHPVQLVDASIRGLDPIAAARPPIAPQPRWRGLLARPKV